MSVARFIVGDTREQLALLPESSVDLVLSSPPFLALRSYLPAEHPEKGSEIGSEATPGEFLDVILDVVEACARVLTPHGSLVFEFGDSYSGSNQPGTSADEGMSYVEKSYITGRTPHNAPRWVHDRQKRSNKGAGWPLDKSLSMIPQSFAWALAYGRNPWTGRTTDPWRIRNFCPWVRPNPPVGALCVDDQTEALTPDGWRTIDQLEDGDLIAAYDPSRDSCRFVPAKFVRYEREGEPMVSVEKRSTSQRMTLDHRAWTRTRKMDPHVRLARDLTNDCDTLLGAPLDDVPGPAPVTTERAALLGWFVAEGTPHHRQARIVQSLTANPEKVWRIRGLLDLDGADYRETVYRHPKGSDVVTFHVKGELAEWLNLHHKRLPMSYVTTWPEAQARALFDALIDGDGHRRKSGRGLGLLFHQKDEAIADAVQVLGMRFGYRATKSYQPSMRLWQITMGTNRWTRIRKWDGTGIPTEFYTGTVWCPMVETGLWLARRNGRPFVTGNSDKFRPATSYLTVACKARDRWFDLDSVRTAPAREGFTFGCPKTWGPLLPVHGQDGGLHVCDRNDKHEGVHKCHCGEENHERV